MHNLPIEADYPASFRRRDAEELAAFIKQASSVELVGMKRVGISNFLRFFIYNPLVKKRYFATSNTFFIPVDLNELIESEVYPFWLLTFKRVLDAVEHDGFDEKFRDTVNARFNRAIQTRDHFLTIDGLRKTLIDIVEFGYKPVLFLIRFGRMKDAITPDLYLNLQGLRDATHKKLVYVFTGFRELAQLHRKVVEENTTSVFYRTMYIRPLEETDSDIIAQSLEKRYGLKIGSDMKKKLIELSGGHVQYLNICLIALHEYHITSSSAKSSSLSVIEHDERIALQSDELFSRLTDSEQKTLLSVIRGELLTSKNNDLPSYLLKTGMVKAVNRKYTVFSQFLRDHILNIDHTRSENKELYFTNKEHALFSMLKKNMGNICDRDAIIHNVWPEYSESGISDWAIDRLVARVRKKLKRMNSEFSIKTIRTRGFMLIEKG